MEKFTVWKGRAAPLMVANVNTDAIAPSTTARKPSPDLGVMLFANQRFRADGSEIEDFVLNQPKFRDATVLVAGANFGCGSSRERAVWCLMKYGFRAVIAPSFGDIFHQNSFQNGFLPVMLPEEECVRIGALLNDRTRNDTEIEIDLLRSVVVTPDGREIPFTIPAERRMALIEGLEEVNVILRMEDDIAAFQAKDRLARPWAYP